jgi:threonine dehydrogenase-like Zn-dependent dehydrogenase
MRAVFMYEGGNVQVEDAPQPELRKNTDAIVRVVRTCICGSDLHRYHKRTSEDGRIQMGHEFVGIVEELGSEVTTLNTGDFVIAPFAISCGTCEYCQHELYTSCVNGQFWASGEIGGAQAEYVRVPYADGTLVAVPGITEESDLLPSLLTLSDVYGTGYHAAKTANVQQGDEVVVIGDGAVGLLAVLSAKQLGAENIILMGRHEDRTALGKEFGATAVVSERGVEGIQHVLSLTESGRGAQKVLEAVGFLPAYEQALGVVRAGGTISRVGVPQYDLGPIGVSTLWGRNITLTGGVAPVRRYISELLPGVLSGVVNPGKVFDLTMSIENAAEGYRLMDSRSALKVQIAF